MVGWHHQLDEHEFEQALGDGKGQGRTGVLQSMGSERVRHMTEQPKKNSIPCDYLTEQCCLCKSYQKSF